MIEYVVIVAGKEKLVTTQHWRASMKMRYYQRKEMSPLLATRKRGNS